MSKVGSHDPFGHLKHKLWWKEGPGVKLVVWFPTTKSRESTQFPCVQVSCNILLKISWQGLQLCFIPHLNWRLHTKLWDPKVAGVPTLAISGLPFGSPRTKCHLDVGLMERHKVYYKGEGGGFPQVPAVVSFMSPSLFVVCPSTKSALTMHQLTCWVVLCRSMWVNKCLSFFLVPSQNSNTPLNPPKVLQAKERAPTFDYFVVFTLDSHLSLSRSLGVCHLL
jgi:hypothetical protein